MSSFKSSSELCWWDPVWNTGSLTLLLCHCAACLQSCSLAAMTCCTVSGVLNLSWAALCVSQGVLSDEYFTRLITWLLPLFQTLRFSPVSHLMFLLSRFFFSPRFSSFSQMSVRPYSLSDSSVTPPAFLLQPGRLSERLLPSVLALSVSPVIRARLPHFSQSLLIPPSASPPLLAGLLCPLSVLVLSPW